MTREGKARARVFVATPFEALRAGNEDPAVFARVQDSITEAARLADVELRHPRASQQAGNILAQILAELDDADAVIAVVTGSNPNVLFELGYAARQAPILVIDKRASLPFDLRIYRAVVYGGPGELVTLASRLAEAIRHTLAAAHDRFEVPVDRYLASVQKRVLQVHGFLPGVLRDRFESDLAKLFVAPRITRDPPDHATLVDWTDVLEGGARCSLVLGHAGAGKSTLLQMLAARAWEACKTIGLDRPHLPLLVSASALDSAPGPSIAERLHGALSRDRNLLLPEALPDDFIAAWSRHARRPWLVLIDALDEVPRPRARDLVTWIEQLLDYCAANGHRIVLGSRPDAPEIGALAKRAAVFRLTPFDGDRVASLVQTILGDDAGSFLREMARSRLGRLNSPWLLVLAASLFARTATLPTKHADLLEQVIESALDRGREAGRLGEPLAPVARAVLGRVASAPAAREADAVAQFLTTELRMSEVEARGRAPRMVRELAQGSGLMTEVDGVYRFTSLPLLEHLLASEALRSQPTLAQRSALVEVGWSKRPELILGLLGLIDDERQVSKLVRRVFPGRIRRWFMSAARRLQCAEFVVDCILDGVPIDEALRRDVEVELDALSTSSGGGPSAAEQLGRLGDPTALVRWLDTPGAPLEQAGYAAVALSLLGYEAQLLALVGDDAARMDLRVFTLCVLAQDQGPEVALYTLRAHRELDRLHLAAIGLVARDAEMMLHALRGGWIGEDSVDAVVIACAEERQLAPLFQAAEDEAIDASLRERLGQRLPAAAVVVFQDMAKDPTVEARIRVAVEWLVDPQPDATAPDLGPLFSSESVVPAIKVAAAVLAIARDRSAVDDLAARRDLPGNVQRFLRYMLDSHRIADGDRTQIARDGDASRGR